VSGRRPLLASHADAGIAIADAAAAAAATAAESMYDLFAALQSGVASQRVIAVKSYTRTIRLAVAMPRTTRSGKY